jgi:hypothetical protein
MKRELQFWHNLVAVLIAFERSLLFHADIGSLLRAQR